MHYRVGLIHSDDGGSAFSNSQQWASGLNTGRKVGDRQIFVCAKREGTYSQRGSVEGWTAVFTLPGPHQGVCKLIYCLVVPFPLSLLSDLLRMLFYSNSEDAWIHSPCHCMTVKSPAAVTIPALLLALDAGAFWRTKLNSLLGFSIYNSCCRTPQWGCLLWWRTSSVSQSASLKHSYSSQSVISSAAVFKLQYSDDNSYSN